MLGNTKDRPRARALTYPPLGSGGGSFAAGAGGTGSGSDGSSGSVTGSLGTSAPVSGLLDADADTLSVVLSPAAVGGAGLTVAAGGVGSNVRFASRSSIKVCSSTQVAPTHRVSV